MIREIRDIEEDEMEDFYKDYVSQAMHSTFAILHYKEVYERMEEEYYCLHCVECRYYWICDDEEEEKCYDWLESETGLPIPDVYEKWLDVSNTFHGNWIIEYLHRVRRRLIAFAIAEMEMV